jgi:hypothetical protein
MLERECILKIPNPIPIYGVTASGVGVGANPTAWFVVVAFFSILVHYLVDQKNEMPMETVKTGRKADQVKSGLKKVVNAAAETSWAIATGLAAGLVTPSIHAKGAPLTS